MDADFWHQRWQSGELGFHQKEANRMLVDCFTELSITEDDRVFVPLCGKSLDIAWLLSRRFRVAGAELSELAVTHLFSELGVDPGISDVGNMRLYSAEGIDIFVGDIFDLAGDMLGSVQAVYDRAALVALPEGMRERYAKHVMMISNRAPQFLLTFEYDQTVMNGPPFSLNDQDVMELYKDTYEVTLLAHAAVSGGLKGICPATENAWLLEKTPGA